MLKVCDFVLYSNLEVTICFLFICELVGFGYNLCQIFKCKKLVEKKTVDQMVQSVIKCILTY